MSSKGSRRGAKPSATSATAELSAIEIAPAPAAIDLAAIDLGLGDVTPAATAVAPVQPQVPATPVDETIHTQAPVQAGTTPAIDPVAPTQDKEDTIMATNFETANANPAAMMGDMNDRAKAAITKGQKFVEEMNDFAKGNVEAVVESSRITAKGFESMGQDVADYSRRSFESATAAFKSMASIKSPTELFKMQGDFMRTSFDAMVAETSKSTEAMLKLAGEAVQPISNRFAVAVEKVKTAA